MMRRILVDHARARLATKRSGRWLTAFWSAWDLCEHHARNRELVRKYADQPMDLANACLVAMSEKWWECKVVTVDVNDFKVYRRRGWHPIPLLTPNAS